MGMASNLLAMASNLLAGSVLDETYQERFLETAGTLSYPFSAESFFVGIGFSTQQERDSIGGH